jgi:hypothetical protein
MDCEWAKHVRRRDVPPQLRRDRMTPVFDGSPAMVVGHGFKWNWMDE